MPPPDSVVVRVVRVVRRLFWVHHSDPPPPVTSPALLRYLERQRFGNAVEIEGNLLRLEKPPERTGDLTLIVVVPITVGPLSQEIIETVIEAGGLDADDLRNDIESE